ncbi:hypothetical protein [Klebsiella oxytoca]|uniref:hypothetical protein n=1 Tax=Klebsiella oxytoca TaxID=571 RepID=UPI0005175E78|nr:hypothetical protein [Klebsiella oxytoca]EGT0047709.1 hypothetical protein [Klebsiella oxytoca]ELP2754537.1 hypothetical protein [Klebsiella oxytoca]ELR0728512.1 hypothetical protein [Klebsiella oxytoca]MBG2601256.1 hypothetical protein [Klebsiella oxytoca]MBG2687238.1 hypothetical protein [Klebsiella oxytoca]
MVADILGSLARTDARSVRNQGVAMRWRKKSLHAVAYNDKTTQPYEYYWFAFRKWILILKKIL